MLSDIYEGLILWGKTTHGNLCGLECRMELGVGCSSSWSYAHTSQN
jgi:hypothetical protein